MTQGTNPSGQQVQVSIPRGLDPWLVEFIKDVQRETQILRENGADNLVTARDAVLRKLLLRATEYLDSEVGVSEAADILQRDEETVRRSIRSGRLPDLRSKPRGHHRTRRGDVIQLSRKQASTYDPIADAQAIAKLRKTG